MLSQPADLTVPNLLSPELLQDFGIAVSAIVASYLLSALLTTGAVKLTTRTETDLDDAIIGELRPAIFFGLLAFAAWMSLDNLRLSGRAEYVAIGLLGTGAAFVLGRALYRVAVLLIGAFGRSERAGFRIERRLVPLAEYATQLVVWLGTLYAVLAAWELAGTLLGTSAGMLGLALGLAAEGSLANVIAGLFIAVDQPCRVGDFIVLADTHGRLGGERGRITQIGLRSVRVLTNDGVEIVVPNSQLGASRIVNETAGPDETLRLRTRFILRHDADVERVRALVEVDLPPLRGLAAGRRPELRVLELDARGIHVGVFFWLSEPSLRLPGYDSLNTWLYGRLTAAGVRLAPPQHVAHVDAIEAVLASLSDAPRTST